MIVYVNWEQERIVSTKEYDKMTEATVEDLLEDADYINELLEDMGFSLVELFQTSDSGKKIIWEKIKEKAYEWVNENSDFEEYEINL